MRGGATSMGVVGGVVKGSMSTARARDRGCASEIFEFPTRVEYDDTGHRDDRETGARELGPHVSGLWFMMENVGRGLGRGSAGGAPRLHFEDSVEKARAMRGDVRVEAPASRHGRGWRVRVPQETPCNDRVESSDRRGAKNGAVGLWRGRAPAEMSCSDACAMPGLGASSGPRVDEKTARVRRDARSRPTRA